MTSLDMTVDVARPLDEVFAFVSDLGNDPKWRREWERAERLTQGPIGVGSSYAHYASVLGKQTRAVYEVTEFDASRLVRWRTVEGRLPLSFWRRVDRVDGGTRVTMGYSGDFPGLLGLLRPLLIALGRRALGGDLPTLQRVLEADQ
jgi:uncharacterized membrane protein